MLKSCPNIDRESEDTRRQRSRSSLQNAVLELAAERDITTASVAELTRRAGIHRATFYAHASTPVDLLAQVLASELDVVRTALESALDRVDLEARALTRQSFSEVIDHVLRHEAVYGSVNRASSVYALRVVLAEHIAGCVSLVLRKHPQNLPSDRPDDIALYAAFMAYGAAGAVEAWLRQPRPRSRRQILDAVEATLPDWYASP